MAVRMSVPEVPVYLFTGFLEAGKTTFVQETLCDERFNDGEKTLVILCEEGEAELDVGKMPHKNVFIRTIEDKEELNPIHLEQMRVETGAGKVVLEYNGMWMIAELAQRLPENWAIYQEMCFADARTFVNYNANMRSLVVDKLQGCELIVFNRFAMDMDKMTFHKIVRGVSRRADIAYEYADKYVEYDDIKDPLPFDIYAPVIRIKDEDYAIWYRDLNEEPAKYEGKVVEFKGIVSIDKKFPPRSFAIGRHIMTCCVEDISYCPLVAQWDSAATLHPRDWLLIRAKIHFARHKLYRGKGPVLDILDSTPAAPPAQEVATFY